MKPEIPGRNPKFPEKSGFFRKIPGKRKNPGKSGRLKSKPAPYHLVVVVVQISKNPEGSLTTSTPNSYEITGALGGGGGGWVASSHNQDLSLIHN